MMKPKHNNTKIASSVRTAHVIDRKVRVLRKQHVTAVCGGKMMCYL